MSRGLAKYNKRRVLIAGGAAAVVLSGAVIATNAMAGEESNGTNAATLGTVNCPAVAPALPAAIPASAQAEVDQNLTLLNTQIAEANQRLATSVGQGGPNFAQNAIVGPLKDKRVATINRIATAIGRTAAKPELAVDALATCTLNAGGAANQPAAGSQTPAAGNAGNAGNGNTGNSTNAAGTVNCPAVAPALPAIPASAQAEVDQNLTLLNTQIAEANQRLINTVGQGGANFVQNAILGPLKDKRVATINRMATAIGRAAARPELPVDALATCTLNAGGAAEQPASAAPVTGNNGNAGNAGNNGNAGNAGNGNNANAGAAGTVNCPAVAPSLPAIPASAQAEIDRNLALLDTQIAEANQRLINTVGQGGPNFVQNAILGPLKDKRVATINRMATAIGRTAAKPELPVDTLATCTLNS
ncbi:hypothetical protein [Streptomyces paludis]|uniref:Secreted protein n=1 Tax=Streptomyces paludis TaxID=2282738 RepID=A0A345HJR1_9ACTN|nr:hypothetical protein DVK44_03680 [Streptomyces paludis]